MSTKFMITYKRKRVTSHAHTADGTIPESSAASSSVAPKYGVYADNNVLNEDNFSTSTKQQDVCKSMQQSIKEETPKQSAHASEKEQKELQLCESLRQKEQTEIYCGTSLSIAEACKNKLQCTNDINNPIPASSSVCDLMHADGTTNQAEDCSTSAPAGINSHQGPNDITKPSQCKNRFSPLLTFHRRVKKKINLDEPAEENYSKGNEKQCPALTSSPPSSSLNATPLLKETGGNSLHIEDKVSTGLSVPAEHLLEQKSSHILKSSVQHMVSPQPAEDLNQSFTPEHDGTPVSEFTSVREISGPDARVEDSSKTPTGVTVVPKVIRVKGEGHGDAQTSSPQSSRQKINVNLSKPTNKSVADDLLESQGSTKNIPIIVLDDESDERGKEPENSEVLDQVAQEKIESRFALGQINLNCAELPQKSLLVLDDSSVQRLPYQDQFGNEQKQVLRPIERLFFTKEQDGFHGKQQHHEGTSTVHSSYSNFFDPTPSWNTGSFKEPRNMPSELKFRIMDKVPEFNLDLSLDSFPDSSVSALRRDKLFRGGRSCGSHLLTERLGTYSYKRHSVPWSEEELDFLWIGVRRYGTNNWNAMLRDTQLRFSNSRMAEDLAKQWDKEQKKLLGVDLLQSIRVSGLGHTPPPHIAEDYVGSSSCSGCSKSPFLAAQTDLSLGDMYIRNARASERGQHHLSSMGILNLHGIDNGQRNVSLGGLPVASSSYGRSASKRRRPSKFHKSYYDSRSLWCQEPSESERVSQLLPINQQPINSLPQWLTKDVETGISQLDSEMWPSMQAPGRSAADPLNDSLRAAPLFPDDMKPHVLPDASLKRKAEWRTVSKKLFRTGDTLDLNQSAAAMAGPHGGATASDTGASSEETVSDS